MTEIIGVVGLGTMGLGIAQLFAQAGFSVIATDQTEAARTQALDRLRQGLEPRVLAGKMDRAAMEAALARLRVVEGVEAMVPCTLIIEAIVERLEAKQALFQSLQVIAPDAVFATNTSALSVTAISATLPRPERLVGLHFFNPVPVMRLVEVIATAATDPAALILAKTLTEATGKTVIQCADTPGFIVNRCARPYYGEALALLEEGRSAGEIDAAMVAAGYRIGPFGLIDLIGADINLAATEGLSAGMGNHPRYHVFDALKGQVASGNLGRKTGRGFVYPGADLTPPADAAAIALRIEATLANEAATLLPLGLRPDDIDTALRLGLNFPRGPFESARHHGIPAILATLATLEAAAPPRLKTRYTACPALKDLT